MSDVPKINFEEEEAKWAAEMSPAEKFIAGARLFDYACAIMMAGIRRQHPEATDEQVLDMVRERLDWASRWDESD